MKVPVTNPWLKKNPLLSIWLSGANRAAGSLRGRAANGAKRHAAAVTSTVSRQIFDFWTGGLAPRAPAKKRARKRR